MIKSDNTLLSRSTRLPVRRYFWYIPLRSHQGAFDEKKSFSIWRACDHVMFALSSADEGCLTQNQLFSSASFSLRIKGSQLDSSPVGIRSGLVKTPIVERTSARHNKLNLEGQTDGPLPLRIMLFGQAMSTLIFKVGYSKILMVTQCNE